MQLLLLRSIIVSVLLLAHEAAAGDMMIVPEVPRAANNVSVFSGFELTSIGSYTGWAGATLAPWGNLDTSGLRIGLFDATGIYSYSTGASSQVRGIFTSADILVGYGANVDSFAMKVSVGLNLQEHRLSGLDPSNPVQGSTVGLKLQADSWVNPTERTMLFGLVSYSTAFRTYYATLKAGYAVIEGQEVFIGPEVIFQGNEHYSQWRLGAHLTGVKTRGIEVGFSGGLLHSTDSGSGAYGKIDLAVDF
jgi:hypothetical protein